MVGVRGGGTYKSFLGGVAEIKYSACPSPFMRPREARHVRDRYGRGTGCLRDYKQRLLKSFLVVVAEIKYSVCPRPLKRPREAIWDW